MDCVAVQLKTPTKTYKFQCYGDTPEIGIRYRPIDGQHMLIGVTNCYMRCKLTMYYVGNGTLTKVFDRNSRGHFLWDDRAMRIFEETDIARSLDTHEEGINPPFEEGEARLTWKFSPARGAFELIHVTYSR